MEQIKILGSRTRLEIIKALAKGSITPTELSKKLNRSLPTITRHLNQLERVGLIERVGEKIGKTRPYQKYALREFIFVFEALKGEVNFIHLPLTEMIKAHLRIWSIPQREFHYYVERFFWDIQNFLPVIESIAVYGSVAKGNAREGSDVDVLILAESDVKKLKEEYGAKVIKKPEEEAKMFMAQVFKPSEFEAALKSGSDFAHDLMKNIIPLYDPNRFLEKLRVRFSG